MKIPLVDIPVFGGTRRFECAGQTFWISNSGHLNISLLRADDGVVAISWAHAKDSGEPAIHVRRGNAPIARIGNYIGLFGSTEDVPADLRVEVETLVKVALGYDGRQV